MQDILFSELNAKEGKIGQIILNRPQSLNALTLDMCKSLSEKLSVWEENSEVKVFLIKSSGDKAFCAGGDIRHLYHGGKKTLATVTEFFKYEYFLNKQIFHLKKPYISLLNGITMGGGVGISLTGSYPIATENLLFAMPETGIGFFPDIGASYFLTRCPGKMGWYLGLTGEKIRAHDAYHLDLFRHVIAADKLHEFENALLQQKFLDDSFACINTLLEKFAFADGSSDLLQKKPLIDECFAKNSVEETFQALAEHHDNFSLETLGILKKRSPTSLKVTLEYLNRSVALDFDAIMQMNVILAQRFFEHEDVYEGIRAMVIDKDKNPQWKPNCLEEISKEMVLEYFLQDEG